MGGAADGRLERRSLLFDPCGFCFVVDVLVLANLMAFWQVFFLQINLVMVVVGHWAL